MQSAHALAITLILLSLGCLTSEQTKTTPTGLQATLKPSTTTITSTITSTTTTSTSTTIPPTSTTRRSREQSASSTTSLTVASGPQATLPELSISVQTDKPLYRSRENMTITVVVESPTDLGKVVLDVHGIKAGYERLNKKQDVEVNAGSNTYRISYKTPSCTGCAGINPGRYIVHADVLLGNQLLGGMSTEVEVRQ